MRTNYFQILFAVSFTVFINTFGFAQELPSKGGEVKPRQEKDSLNLNVSDLAEISTNERDQDSTVQDSVKPKKGFLTDIVNYSASDYTSFNRKEQKLYLYNEAQIQYQDMDIKSGVIVIDYNKKEVYAGRIKDSLGEYSQAPVFTQGSNVVEPDSIRFNYETKKAIIFNSQTEQNDFHITAPITKKENDSVIFMSKARFTTSKTPEDPEYYFQTNKIKFVPKKKIVVGPTNMVIANVPTPVGIPFGFFPLTDKQTSGVIIPTFGEQNSRGYFLQNGGYYFAVSDYFDFATLGDYYTNGSYGLRLESNYAKRYRYRGNLSFRYENLIDSERGFPDYSKSTIYNIRWSHNQDAKANPSSRLSASVNFGSSKYYQTSINQTNAPNFLNNTMQSTVSYNKSFQGEPQVNFAVTASHQQNTNTEDINMTLPSVQGSVSNMFPFAPKNGIKKGIIQNIRFQYNLKADNRIETTDSLFFKKQMFDDARAGIQHNIPISTNFKVFKHFSVTAGTNFQENWVFKTTKEYYEQEIDSIVREDVKGFDSYRTYNFNTSVGTTIYGMFPFKTKDNNPKIQAIRHVMRPSVSYNINPSFDEYYDSYEVIDADGTTIKEEYTRFQNSIFGTPNRTYSSAIGLGLSNNIEAKIRDKDSTATEAKKTTLLNNLNFSTSYNLAADSLRWSSLRMTGGTQILDNKMSINFNATMDPYALDNNNKRIDKFNIDNGGSLFRLTQANITMNYTLSSDLFKESDEDKRGIDENVRSGGRDDNLFGVSQDYSDHRTFGDDEDEEEEPTELYKSKIPWSLRLAYAVNYANSTRQNEISSHSLMFSGDIELSPRWTVGASSGYDFKNKGFTYTQLRFERDLLSWRMNFSWVPFSSRKSWYFFIGIKSSMLKDIKYDKRRQPDQRL